MERKLEHKYMAGYIPYNVCAKLPHGILTVGNHPDIHGVDNLVNYGAILREHNNYKLILRPLSDLYRTITHNGKEVTPILELARIAAPDIEWELHTATEGWSFARQEKPYLRFEYEKDQGSFILTNGETDWCVGKLPKLFDCMNSLLIDYRGLIDADLAASVYDLDTNPYK